MIFVLTCTLFSIGFCVNVCVCCVCVHMCTYLHSIHASKQHKINHGCYSLTGRAFCRPKGAGCFNFNFISYQSKNKTYYWPAWILQINLIVTITATITQNSVIWRSTHSPLVQVLMSYSETGRTTSPTYTQGWSPPLSVSSIPYCMWDGRHYLEGQHHPRRNCVYNKIYRQCTPHIHMCVCCWCLQYHHSVNTAYIHICDCMGLQKSTMWAEITLSYTFANIFSCEQSTPFL